MSEISAQFSNQVNGYNKTEVNKFMEDIEATLQERAAAIDSLQEQVSILQEKLEKACTPEALEASNKIELYDKLMKKMDEDYNNLLAPAVAKKKAIEEQAARDYEIRMDQARATADGIYELAAGRIADAVDQNLNRMYDLLDEYMYSKSLPGRVENFFDACSIASAKIASGIVTASKLPGKAYNCVSTTVKTQVAKAKAVVDTYKQNKAAKAEETVEG